MKALTVKPGAADSARVEEGPEPPAARGALLVQALAVGVCGTDLEITAGEYGWAPPGRDRLVLGHESLGRVREAPAGGGPGPGEPVGGVGRRAGPATGSGALRLLRQRRARHVPQRGLPRTRHQGARRLRRPARRARGRVRR